MVFMSGCKGIPSNSIENMVSPINRTSPVEGTWELSDIQNSSRDTAQFTKDGVLIYGTGYGNINYTIKKVKIQEYFLFNKYKVTPEKLGIKDKSVFVITLTSADTLIGDFIKIDENNAVGFILDNIYLMKKVSDKIDNKIYESINASESRIEIQAKENSLKSGVLIGLKSFDKKDEYVYRTLWISSNNSSLNGIEEITDLLFPRKSGFWKLTSQKVKNGDVTQDVLEVYDLSRKDEAFAAPPDINLFNKQNKTGRIYKSIMYLCNDYVSIEVDGSGKYNDSQEKWKENRLHLIPVDSVSSLKGVKISEIAGNNGLKELRTGKKDLLLKLGGVVELNRDLEEENFGVVRRTGHWILRGRVNYERNSEVAYSDYNINVVPPEKLVFYDTLSINWNSIKNKVPDAVDAYTSPNKDIAIILTKSKLFIYAMTKGRLEDKPLEKIDLREGEVAVMAEWATGNYVDNWNNTINKAKENKFR